MIETTREDRDGYSVVTVRIPQGAHWLASRWLRGLKVITAKGHVVTDEYGSWIVLEFWCEQPRKR